MSTPHQNIIWRNPALLQVHPAVANLHGWSDNDADFDAMCDDMRHNGFMPVPVILTKDFLIIDGRHRCRAAALQQLDVPCVIVDASTDQEVIQIALRTIKNRRHYTAGQLAIVAYPAMEQACEAAKQANIAALKNGNTATKTPVRTVDEIAHDLGISRDSFDKAAEIYAIWRKHASKKFTFSQEVIDKAHPGEFSDSKYTLEEIFHPLLMRKPKPMGLGACLAGMGMIISKDARGDKHGGGIPIELEKKRKLFTQTFETLEKRFDYWESFDEDSKKQARQTIQDTFAKMPEDLLLSFQSAARSEITKRKDNA